MSNSYIDNGDGTHSIEISFDITEQGHTMGVPRNYSLSSVQKMIRSKKVQEHIKSGYAICMYGHSARNKAQGYIAVETNHETKEPQEPLGKLTSLKIRNKIITYTMELVETSGNKTESVVKFIKNGIGGFSFVMDVEKNLFFYGLDFVLSPNFNGNRVVMDSICTDGVCGLDSAMNTVVSDAIGDNKDFYDDAMELLMAQDGVEEALKFRDTIKAKLDTAEAEKLELEKEKLELEEKLDEAEDEKANIREKLAIQREENSKLKEDAVKMDNISAETLKKNEELEALMRSIDDAGLSVEGGAIKVSEDVFKGLFSNTESLFDKVDTTELNKKKTPSPFGAVGRLGYN